MDTSRPKRPSLGFGLDRIGILALDRPLLTAVVLAVIAVVTAVGLFQVSVDRNLRELFRGETAIYETYEAVTDEFVDPENEILVLVEDAALGEGDTLLRLQDFHLDLALLPGIRGVFSLFSLQTSPDETGQLRPLITDAAAGLDAGLIEAIRDHPLLGSSLLSADADTTMLIVTPATEKASQAELAALIEEIDELIPGLEESTGADATITGSPELRAEIVRLLERDQLVLNGAGLVIGFILSLFLFRSVIAALMTAVPAALAGTSLIGWTAILGIDVTVMSNVVPALVMILGYADGMHLTYAWRRSRDLGHSPVEAERHALAEIAPACILAALATAVAFLSMVVSDVAMVRSFGWIGAVGIITGIVVVLVAHGLAARILGPLWAGERKIATIPMGRIAGPLEAVTRFAIRFRWPLAVVSLPLTAVFVALFLSVPPENSITENIPTGSRAGIALETIDRELGGVLHIQIVVPLAGIEATSADGLARIRAVHDAATGVPGVRSGLSLWSLAAWLGAGDAVSPAIQEGLERLAAQTLGRFVGASGALVTVNISEAPTAETRTLVDAIEAAVTAVAPDAIVTGATVVSAREATRTINNLNVSLAIDVVVTLLLIGVAFRRPIVGLVALVPNLLPIAATGSLLYFLGNGMQLTSVISLTIAYGIAVDDTVHYLNTIMHETRGTGARDRLTEAARRVGPVLVGTTLVIITGLTMTLTSGLPTVVSFGLLAMTSLLAALFGDVLFLPAIIAGPARRWFGGGPPKALPVRDEERIEA